MVSAANGFVVNSPRPPADAARGIADTDLNDSRKEMLGALIESCTADMPRHADRRRAGLVRRDQGSQPRPDPVRLVRAADRNQPRTWRVQGPTFLIAFNNSRNDAKHIHSACRNVPGDIGVPLASRRADPEDPRP